MEGLSRSAKITMGLSPQIIFIFCLISLITVFNFAILHKTQNALKEKNNWVLHTHEVIEESERYLGYLRDIETGQRGFLLTLKQTYLEPFNSSIKQFDQQFALLKKLTEDNLEQQTRLDKIQALVNQKKSELERTIQLAQQDELEEALKIVNSDRGKFVMDEIRLHIGDLISIEKNLLNQHKISYLEKESFLNNLFLFEAAILLMIIFISYIFLRKNVIDPLKEITRHFISKENVINCIDLTLNSRSYEIRILADAINIMQQEILSHSKEKDKLIFQLEQALSEIKTLQGILPICSFCKNIRNDEGYYEQLESYINRRTGADFSHTICEPCMEKHYPEEYESIIKGKSKN